jgi:hypothetical protein
MNPCEVIQESQALGFVSFGRTQKYIVLALF